MPEGLIQKLFHHQRNHLTRKIITVDPLDYYDAVIEEKLVWYELSFGPILLAMHCNLELLRTIDGGNKLIMLETPDVLPDVFEGRKLRAVALITFDNNILYKSPGYNTNKSS